MNSILRDYQSRRFTTPQVHQSTPLAVREPPLQNAFGRCTFIDVLPNHEVFTMLMMRVWSEIRDDRKVFVSILNGKTIIFPDTTSLADTLIMLDADRKPVEKQLDQLIWNTHIPSTRAEDIFRSVLTSRGEVVGRYGERFYSLAELGY